jgi:hypothetical protein
MSFKFSNENWLCTKKLISIFVICGRSFKLSVNKVEMSRRCECKQIINEENIGELLLFNTLNTFINQTKPLKKPTKLNLKQKLQNSYDYKMCVFSLHIH